MFTAFEDGQLLGFSFSLKFDTVDGVIDIEGEGASFRSELESYYNKNQALTEIYDQALTEAIRDNEGLSSNATKKMKILNAPTVIEKQDLEGVIAMLDDCVDETRKRDDLNDVTKELLKAIN